VTRVFFGLELDPVTALQVANWRDRQLNCTATPVPPANFHITLAFIGALNDPAIERLCLSVDDWLARTAIHGGSLILDRTGYWNKPGVYWLGPGSWPEPLTRLAKKLSSLGSAVGAKRDRKAFAPHITVFRQCAAAPPAAATMPAIPLSYRHFVLFESRQGKRGVSYHALQHWNLRGHGD
jgi:RNA 2',3'-cyclic 3'-phosphodiesterase